MIYAKQGDTKNGLEIELVKENGTVDITDATVIFKVNGQERSVEKITATQIVVPFAGLTDEPGRYDCEVVVTYTDGLQDTFPTQGYIKLIIYKEVL